MSYQVISNQPGLIRSCLVSPYTFILSFIRGKNRTLTSSIYDLLDPRPNTTCLSMLDWLQTRGTFFVKKVNTP